MFIFPAIDIQNGECVRLTRGDFETAERVAEDPLQTALAFQEAGAEWIHMVDLDGAKSAQMVNRDVFITVARETKLKVEVGGGIRDLKTAEYYLEHGIERVILGSAAIYNPKMVAELVCRYGDRIVVGIDAENGIVKIDGWVNTGNVSFLTLAREMNFIGVQHIIYTDISKDGTLAGPNLADLKKLRDSVRMNVIASGGIRNLEDIKALGDLQLYGAICGKSLYHGTLDLGEAITEGAKSTPVELPDPDEADEAMEQEYLAEMAARNAARARSQSGRGQNARPRNESARNGQNRSSQSNRSGRSNPSGQKPEASRPHSGNPSGGTHNGGKPNRNTNENKDKNRTQQNKPVAGDEKNGGSTSKQSGASGGGNHRSRYRRSRGRRGGKPNMGNGTPQKPSES